MDTNAKRTKILCTLGPATDSKREISDMVHAGMDLARLNMSHGDHADQSSRLNLVRFVSKRLKRPIGIVIDLQGPKLRLGHLGPGKVTLSKGQTVQLGGAQPRKNILWLPTPFRRLGRELQKGDRILLADGAVALRTLRTSGAAVIACVLNDGAVSSHQGINLPGCALSIPSLTQKDKNDLRFAVDENTDFVALSFVRSARDVIRLKDAMSKHGLNRRVIAKIEKPQALDDIDNIIDVADGIMVARGDLGVELSVEKVPAAQKMIIGKCADAEKWVIVATQMLESMIENVRPTRAEASDVANAVYDGADCVMLSAETSVGRDPTNVVRMMATICVESEATDGHGQCRTRHTDRAVGHTIRHATIDAALMLLDKSEASALWVFTLSGDTALLASKQRPRKPIIAFAPHQETLRYCSGLWGVWPTRIPIVNSMNAMIAAGEKMALGRRLARRGDRVIVLAGQALTPGSTHMIKVHCVGEKI